MEQYAALGRETVLNLSLAVAMILVVVFLLLANPLASALTFACVASAICETVGIMYFIGFRIDSVTVIFLVISLGLAVDYSVHVAHGFLAARVEDIRERLKAALAVRCWSLLMRPDCWCANCADSTCIALHLRPFDKRLSLRMHHMALDWEAQATLHI